MSDFLDRVAAERRADVAADAASRDEFALRAQAMTWHRQLGLRVQSHAQRLQVIAEIKRVSPSSGVLDVGVDPSAQARRYAAAGASAISVLVEPRHWGGSLADLEAVRASVDLPVLAKDVVVDEGQLLLVRAAGADIVLLIAELLDDETLRRFVQMARHLGMEALVEAHEPVAFGRAVASGAQSLPETLIPAVAELEAAWLDARADAEFQDELARVLRDWVGRPTPVTDARRLARAVGLARVLLKREDLAHTGAHKINSAVGQALLARRMGKHRVVAETGAGQHGVASAAACALLGLECVVYMGTVDARRQKANVFRMKLLGAEVREVDAGSRTLKDAVNEAIRDWVTNVRTTYYLLGSAIGPHPYPAMVRDFQAVIGREAREQMLAMLGALPDVVVACVGGGSNAIGIFSAFLDDPAVKLIGVEAGGEGIASGKHAASIVGGSVGVLHGSRTLVLQDDAGQIRGTHSVSAGVDYPGVGPQHAALAPSGRAEYVARTDADALEGFRLLSRTEGIIPALEPAHAIADLREVAAAYGPRTLALVCLSGRGDKDLEIVAGATPPRISST